MRTMTVFAAAFASVLLVFAVGCEGDAADDARAAAEIRAELEGRTFRSERDFPQMVVTSGMGEIAYGPYYVRFRENEVTWFQDDICQGGSYQVDGEGNIEATGWFSGRVTGKYDRDSGRLKWDGMWYGSRR